MLKIKKDCLSGAGFIVERFATVFLLETFAEVTRSAEASLVSHFGDGGMTLLEQLGSKSQTYGAYICNGRRLTEGRETLV